MIQLDQLAAVKMVFPMDVDKLLQLLLATSRQMQEVFIRAYFFVDVVLDGRRDKRKPEFFRAGLQKRNIEGCSVKMYHDRKGGGKGEKLLQNIRFIIGRLRKILPGFPAVCGQISAADQIDAGAARGKSGGFDIEK